MPRARLSTSPRDGGAAPVSFDLRVNNMKTSCWTTG
jgi:hypothetical protein